MVLPDFGNITKHFMGYYQRIQELTTRVPKTLVDFNMPRDAARTPTQASSNFITNKEQGDWAETLIMRAINEASGNYAAVKYGKSDNIVAGEDGFDIFYQEFQAELDEIGKRPDLLIFKKDEFNIEWGYDISVRSHEEIDAYVKCAVAGVEVRSSSFLIDKYDAATQERISKFSDKALMLRDTILSDYHDLLSHPNRAKYIPILEDVSVDTLSAIDFKIPGWAASERLRELNDLLKELKKSIKEIQKRSYLSITPKVEDIKVVYKWIETYDVPHFYFQVFFDKVYGISFEEILRIISDADNEGLKFSVEKDSKNQNKTTIKINPRCGQQVAYKVDEPNHKSVRKEMDRGRLLFYVAFEGGTAYLDVDCLAATLGISPNDF
jgi:type II restriction enzyme